jgi:hypothetical protein
MAKVNVPIILVTVAAVPAKRSWALKVIKLNRLKDFQTIEATSFILDIH